MKKNDLTLFDYGEEGKIVATSLEKDGIFDVYAKVKAQDMYMNDIPGSGGTHGDELNTL